MRSKYSLAAAITNQINETRLEFDLACSLRKDEKRLLSMAKTYAEELIPQVTDKAEQRRNMAMMCVLCDRAKAPHTVTSALCAVTLQLLPETKDAGEVRVMADLHLLRIIRAHEERCALFALAHISVFPLLQSHTFQSFDIFGL